MVVTSKKEAHRERVGDSVRTNLYVTSKREAHRERVGDSVRTNLYGFPAEDEEMLRPLHHESHELLTQNLLYLVCLHKPHPQLDHIHNDAVQNANGIDCSSKKS